jgi:universal stress protein A
MSVYQHILAAVDFGENSAKVLQQAMAMAQLCAAKLSVMHVVNYSASSDTDYMLPDADELENKMIEAARNQIKELLQREALTGSVHAIIRSGRPKIEIVRAAEQEGADLIVVGAHGRHGIAGLLGSTANRVLDGAKCNVLVVY